MRVHMCGVAGCVCSVWVRLRDRLRGRLVYRVGGKFRDRVVCLCVCICVCVRATFVHMID